MNLQIKCDSIRKVYETFCKLYTKVSDYKRICQQIDIELNSKIDHCKSNICLTKEAWYFLKKLRNKYLKKPIRCTRFYEIMSL